MSFPRYPRYKPSGVEWLGEVPEHWQVRRLGNFFRERREKVSDRDYPPLSVTKDGVVPQLETAAKTDDGENRKKVLAGDFVINSRSDRKGSAGVAIRDGSVSLISTVIEPTAELLAGYAHHLLRSQPFQEEYYRYGKGIVADLWSTNYSEMRNITLAVPPREDQRCIAEFLGRVLAQSDGLVAAQEELLERLQEKRQAVISHAVTKGLNPDAPMKPSGIEWLGDIPAHWALKRFRNVLRDLDQGWSPVAAPWPAVDGEWGVLKLSCARDGHFIPEENKALETECEPMGQVTPKAGDVLISRANTRELVGDTGLVLEDCPRLLVPDLLYRVQIDPAAASPAFVCLFLRSGSGRAQIESDARGSSGSMVKLGQDHVRSWLVPCPPLAEQVAIAEYAGREIDRSATMCAEARHAITLLEERRAALISAAVTGQIDVRGLVPQESAS